MKKLSLKTALTALGAAFIWGTAFAFQRMAAGNIGAITFNVCRSVLAALSLCIMIFFSRKRKKPEEAKIKDPKKLIMGGIVCGALVLAASIAQQAALEGTEAGKAGFLTTLYILLVPVFSVIFLRKRVPASLWIGVLAGVVGLYFVSVKENFTISSSDALVLMSAVIYAVYILAVDYYVRFCPSMELNCIQFAVATVLGAFAMFVSEEPTWEQIRVCLIPILYLGIFSSAVAYTLQFSAQKDGNPVAVTLLLSMESVFSVLGAAVLLHEYLSPRELFGCAVMFCAVIYVQLPEGFFKRRKAVKSGQ